MIEVKLPKIREDVNESLVVIWFVSEGDTVKKGDPLLEIQTEKEVSEIEAETSGTVKEIICKRGESAKVGEVLATINPAENKQETKPEEQKLVENAKTETKISAQEQKTEEQKIVEQSSMQEVKGEEKEPAKAMRLAPGLRKLARELNVPLESVAGTGRNGKITEKDIRRVAGQTEVIEAVEKAEESKGGKEGIEPSAEEVQTEEQAEGVPEKEAAQKETQKDEVKTDGAPPNEKPQLELTADAEQAEAVLEKGEGSEKAIPFSGIRGAIARRMTESLQNSAQLTETAWADVTKLVSKKNKLGEEAGWTALIAKAAAQALHNHPLMNAHIKEDKIVPQKPIHLGFAVDTDRGLQVAVLQEADQYSLSDLQERLVNLAEQARKGQLPNLESAGSTFTITSLGAYGIQFFTPIINPPEVAILGIGTIENYLVLKDGKVQEKKRLPLSLTVDHRAVDGAPAAKFMSELIGLLEKPKQFLTGEVVAEKEKKNEKKKKKKKKS